MHDMQQDTQASLRLDRGLANLSFASWRLTRDLVKGVHDVALPGVVEKEDEETNFIHTRLAALHNHLITQPSGHYFFLRMGEGLHLQQLRQQTGAAAPALATVAVLEQLQQPGLKLAAVEPPLPPSVAEVAVPADAQPQGSLLLVSRGQGDLALVQRGPEGAAVSATVYPIRPPAPVQGVRTFYLEAAFQVPGSASDICCVLWAVRPRSDAAPSRCEVFAVMVAVGGGGDGAGELQVKDVKLLRRSSLTPHGVLINPTTASILLALEPVADAQEGGGTQPASQSHAEPVDDSEDPVSPRTLQAAVARLAQFTSEEPAGGVPGPGQWADLYSESGPDGVGDMGQEPACTLYSFDSSLDCVGQMPCLPHKVLTCHRQQGALLLGLTDDVDCAVVELAPAPASSAAAEGAAGALAGFLVRHLSSVPALAYVAAGKLQRKFLLLSPPGGALAAALIESYKFAYLYTPTAPGQEYGQHEVLELDIPEGSPGILGAALLGGGGPGGQRQQLLLLTSTGLRMYDL